MTWLSPDSTIKRRQVTYFFLGLLTISVLVSYAFPPLIQGLRRPLAHWADAAVLEIYTINASHGRQLVGPYSRFGWNHPGPAYFYMLLPLYALSGHNSMSLHLTAFLINLAAVLCIIVAVYRTTRPDFPSLVFYALLILYLRFLCPSLTLIWNPRIIVLPLCLLLFLCAAFSVGRIATLPAMIFVASFVAQTHLGCMPTVCALVFVSLLSHLFYSSFLRAESDDSDEPTRPARTRFWAVAGGIVLLVMWFPPIVEEISNDPGNFGKMRAFFGQAHERHPISDAVVATSREISAPFLRLFGSKTGDFSATSVAVLVSLTVLVGIWAGLRRQRHYCAALCLLSLVGIVVAFWSVTRIIGEILDYLIRWVSCLGVVGVIGAAGAILPPPERGSESIGVLLVKRAVRLAIGLLCVLVMIISVWNMYKTPRPSLVMWNQDLIERTYERLQEYLDENKIEDVHILGDPEVWPFTQAIVLQLYKRGITCSVEDRWTFMSGPQFKRTGTPAPLEVQFFGKPQAARPDLVLLNKGKDIRGDVYVYAADKTHIGRHLYRGPPVTVEKAVKTRGEPRVVADGEIPADGTVFNDPRCLILLDLQASVTVSLPKVPVIGIVLSADGNDAYSVYASADGEHFEEIGLRPVIARFGMITKTCAVEKDLSGFRFVRVSPKDGDGFYSIGEIGFLVQDSSRPKGK